MKFSGAFNEFALSPSPSTTPRSVSACIIALEPFIGHIFSRFPETTMFGSDWPVCNIGGPHGNGVNFHIWVEIVEWFMDHYVNNEELKDNMFWRNACKAYGIEK